MKLYKLVLFTLIGALVVTAFDFIGSWGENSKINIPYGTYISTIIIYGSIAIYIYFINKFPIRDTPKIITYIFRIWLLWILFNIIRGIYLSKDYWDMKYVFFHSIPWCLISLVFFIGNNLNTLKLIFSFTLKFIFIYGFLLIPLNSLTDPELYSRLMVPVSLFILFIPYLNYRWKILIILVSVASIFLAISFRSNIIRISFSVFLLILYYFRNYIHLRLIQILHLLFFAIPILFLYLGLTGTYNIFENATETNSYVTTNNFGDEENFAQDTRTFLYMEVLSSLNMSGNWLLGESASGKYVSNWFYDDGGAQNGMRYGCEVGFLNIILHYGIIGIIIYFLILFITSYVAINKSNNILVKIIGLYIAFRWIICFIEEFTEYDISYYFFWIVIGFASSNLIRRMTDAEVSNFIKPQ